MKRKAPARRNPVARVVRTLRQQKIQSAKAYRRRAKHMKARPDHNGQDGLFILRFRDPSEPPDYSAASRPYSAARGLARMISMISAAAVGMLVPGP